ncbi:MAG: protein translocase subunit SecF, partial [bacterium]
PIIAAILTIVGYSVNDTIVVFDRVRENCRRKEGEVRKSIKAFREVVNDSINQTLSRTTLTGLTTLFVLVVIYLFGGEVLRDFVFALLIGVAVGTYSSVFVASPIVVWWRSRKAA